MTDNQDIGNNRLAVSVYQMKPPLPIISHTWLFENVSTLNNKLAVDFILMIKRISFAV